MNTEVFHAARVFFLPKLQISRTIASPQDWDRESAEEPQASKAEVCIAIA